MKDIQRRDRHPRPPRYARILANRFVTRILHSPWHRLRSGRLLLITFTGRNSGRQFTTPVRYRQEGRTLLLTVLYPWWKNLLAEPAVTVRLRGELRIGRAAVLAERDGGVVVKIHLKG